MLGGATAQYRRLFELSAEKMKNYLFYRPMTSDGANVLVSGGVKVEEREAVVALMYSRNQHLACFAGGMFGIAGQIFDSPEDTEVGLRLTEGCLWAYEVNRNGIMPDTMATIPCSRGGQCAWDENRWFEKVSGSIEKGRAKVQEQHLGPGVMSVPNRAYELRYACFFTLATVD